MRFTRVLTGLSLAICSALGIHLGFTFSAGLIDYVLNYGLSTKGWWAIPIGIVYMVVYYGLFRFFIRKFNMATPGREPAAEEEQVESFDGRWFRFAGCGCRRAACAALYRCAGWGVESVGGGCLHDASASVGGRFRTRSRKAN